MDREEQDSSSAVAVLQALQAAQVSSVIIHSEPEMDREEQDSSSAVAVLQALQAAQDLKSFLGHEVSTTCMQQDDHSTTVLSTTDIAKDPSNVLKAKTATDTFEIQVQISEQQLNKTALHMPVPPTNVSGFKQMIDAETQSLTWRQLTLEMLSNIVSQQVISVSQIQELPHGQGPPCFHMKGILWRDILDMIISTHNVMCQNTGVTFSHNTVQVGVGLQPGKTEQGLSAIYKESNKVDAAIQAVSDPINLHDASIMSKRVLDQVANVEMPITNNDKVSDSASEMPKNGNLDEDKQSISHVEFDIPVKGFPAQCSVCKKRFRSNGILRRHSKVHEENHNRHPCIYCDKVCKTDCYLQRHMATHFKPEKQSLQKRAANARKVQVRKTVAQRRKVKEPAQCSICLKTFTIPRNLKRHELIHQKSYKHPCPHCDKVCRSAHYLQLHLRVHAEEKPHKCEDCGISFGAKHKLKQHRTKEHDAHEQHVCKLCGAIYKHKETLEDHMMSHSNQKVYLCDACGKTFNRPSVYRLHLAYHVSQANPAAHPCNHCPKSYATLGLLNKHTRSAHLKERNHICSNCGLGFFTKQQRLNHEQVHTNTPAHLCTFCGKGFAQMNTLIAHKRMHTGYRPFVCQYCSKGFTSKPHLMKHLKIHTTTEQANRPFLCKVCSSTFTNKTACTDHEKRHAGIKDHKCQFCSVAFVTRGDLIRHLKIHTGGKPFKCHHCDLRFSKKLELTEHEVLHAVVEVPITYTLLPSQ